MEWGNAELSIKEQAVLLTLNRTGLYYQLKQREPDAEEIEIKHRIDELYTECPFYGSRKLRVLLKQKGYIINRKRVQRYMREMGLEAVGPKPNLSKKSGEHKIYPYRLKGLKLSRPLEVWGLDITYIRLKHGWLYLIAIIDWYSRYVISWEVDQTLAIDFVLVAVNRALGEAKPQIMNSDQGSHFTSEQYTRLVEEAGVLVSMDGKGRVFDNIFTERLWRTLKQECIYINEFETPREARQGIRDYLEFYNWRRPHQALGYKTPAEVHYGKVE